MDTDRKEQEANAAKMGMAMEQKMNGMLQNIQGPSEFGDLLIVPGFARHHRASKSMCLELSWMSGPRPAADA